MQSQLRRPFRNDRPNKYQEVLTIGGWDARSRRFWLYEIPRRCLRTFTLVPYQSYSRVSMCERLVIPSRAEVEREFPVARPWWQFSLRFNVAVSAPFPSCACTKARQKA